MKNLRKSGRNPKRKVFQEIPEKREDPTGTNLARICQMVVHGEDPPKVMIKTMVSSRETKSEAITTEILR